METKKLIIALLAIVLVSCMPEATATPAETPMPTATLTSIPPTNSIVPTSTSQQPSPTPYISRYAFPKSVDPAKRYLFYIHGRIIEDQGIPAISPDYGEYEYGAILEKLSAYGFVVISEQRSKDTDVVDYAGKIKEQVAILLEAGVPASNITVVGASKGAAIAIYVSHFLRNEEVNYVIMGICHPDEVGALKQGQIFLTGNVLSIYDSTDTLFAGSCQDLFSFSEGKGISRYDEIICFSDNPDTSRLQPSDTDVCFKRALRS